MADGDVSSFLSTLDEFVEQCDSFLSACPQVSSENDAADVRVDVEDAAGNVSCFHECFTEYSEGQSLPEHASTTPQVSYVEDDRIGPFEDADDVLALSSDDECMEDTLLEQHSPASQNSTSSSARACKGSLEDADEDLALSSEDECTEATRSERYSSISQHSVCPSTRAQHSEQECVYGSQNIHYNQNAKHSQGSEGNDEHAYMGHDANYIILEELNSENSLSPSRDEHFHPHSFQQESVSVSEDYGVKTIENHCRQEDESFRGNFENAAHFSNERYRQEPRAGELSHQNCTRMENAFETRTCSEAPQTNRSNQRYNKFSGSCQVQNASVSCCARCPEQLEEQQYQEYVESFNESCVMEDASTFKKYKDEPLEAESFDDSCIMEDASTFKKYDDVEEMEAKQYAQGYNDSCVMNDVSVFRTDAKTRERNLACSDSSCHIRQRKNCSLPEGHLATPCVNKSAEYVAQCHTNCSPQEILVGDQKAVYEFKTQCSSSYSPNSSPMPSSSVGIRDESCMGDKPVSSVTPHQQHGSLASVEALEDVTSKSSKMLSHSEAADRETDITPASCTVGKKPEHCSSIQDFAALSEQVSSNAILKQHLKQHAIANSPAYFTDVVQSVQNICTTSSLCHEDIAQVVPKFEETDKKLFTALSAPSDDYAGSSSSTEHEHKGNGIGSVAKTSEKVEVVLEGRKDNHNETDIVPAVDKECKETSLAVSPTSKPVFLLDACLQSEPICDRSDVLETTLVAEADMNIETNVQSHCKSPLLSCCVAAGDLLDLGVETDSNTFVGEVQSPVASAISVEDCQPVQLSVDMQSMLPLPCTVTSGDVLDLGVDTDDTLVDEVQSPVRSAKSAEHCQPALQNASASVLEVPRQPHTDASKCMLPRDAPIPSADTISLAANAPVPPLLVCTSSEDEIYIPEDLDMREKLNTIRSQLERHKPEDPNAHVIYTVPTDFRSSEPQLPIVKAPEMKNRAPFTSEDPAENMDNENPEWEAVRRLTTDEERYQAVQAVWHNVKIPDPHKELSTFHYRRRTLSLKHAKNTPSSKSKRRKRKASHCSHHEHSKPAKRQRLDTDIIDLKLKELQRKKEKDVTKAQKTFSDDIRQLHMSLMRTNQETYASHNHHKHHRRAHTEPWDFRYYLSQEQRICAEFKASEQSIENEYMTREHKLLSAREEVRRVDDFYAGLRDTDPRLLSEKQVKEHFKLEEMLGHFRVVYRTPNE